MRVLLVSTYELGHQPLHLASPAAALLAAGHDVRCLDLSVEPWDDGRIDWAEAVAFSVPMHTAMRLAVEAARALRRHRPDTPVCLYGLYAPVSRDLTAAALADHVIGGEYEPALVGWVDGLAEGHRPVDGSELRLERGAFHVPARHLLPPLERYAQLDHGGELRPAGYVEATHGCRHRCGHCPIPAVYDGLLRVVGRDTVSADIDALVAAGARHITFGDPDFLNAPTHALRVLRELNARHPELTWDCTVKVEHILRYAGLWPELAARGCLFVISAVECVSDPILARLDKGHTAADATAAVALLRGRGIEMRPSLLPFTPWTSLDDVVELLDWVEQNDLVPNVDPVQYGIRLLLPEGSLLLARDDMAPHRGPYDPERLGYAWAAGDPLVDVLQARIAERVERAVADGEPHEAAFAAVRRLAREAAGRPADTAAIPAGSTEARPRMTEPWFC